MTYCLFADLAKSNHVLVILSLFAIGIGVFFILTPSQHLLLSDRRTGYWLYRSEMKFSGDEKRAVATAKCFYCCFGGLILAFGIFVLCLAFL